MKKVMMFMNIFVFETPFILTTINYRPPITGTFNPMDVLLLALVNSITSYLLFFSWNLGALWLYFIWNDNNQKIQPSSERMLDISLHKESLEEQKEEEKYTIADLKELETRVIEEAKKLADTSKNRQWLDWYSRKALDYDYGKITDEEFLWVLVRFEKFLATAEKGPLMTGNS